MKYLTLLPLFASASICAQEYTIYQDGVNYYLNTLEVVENGTDNPFRF